MRINHNITAMNTHRQYTIANNSVASSAEKLSSGYRINRAGDDAAGLAISEKMRAQIRGLQMASKNSSDAISLVQTAEGALQSAHDILQRMRELAVQSASDTNEQIIDRGALQQEFEQLAKEINDIATTTRFNDQNLLDGTFQSVTKSLNTANTTLSNINGISVERANAGLYTMSISSTPATESLVVNNGAQCNIFATDTTALGTMADKVTSVSFSGLNTSAHNGNTYTLKVSGSSADKMTFQLVDSNDKVVSTAQNVDTTTWTDSTTNTVSFSGVGTFTFTLKTGEAITQTTDLTPFDGAKLTFGDGNTTFQNTMSNVASLATTGLGASGGTLTAAYTAGTYSATSDAAATGNYKIELSTDASNKLLVTVYDLDGTTKLVDGQDTGLTGLAGDGTATVNLGQYGSILLTNTTAASAALTFDASVAAVSTNSAVQSTDVTTAAGKDQETTMATRASLNLTINGETVTLYKGDTYAEFKDQGISFNFDALSDADVANADYFGTGGTVNIEVSHSRGAALTIQTGANRGDELSINIDKINTESLGIHYTNIANREDASKAIEAVNDAINQVSTQRAALGALQNRLDYKISNLDTSAENLTAAESRIRDVDMAKEMTAYAQKNILVQAATAMLAQANAAPQNVLQLLG